MRSDRIHRALVNIQNRFMLCRLVSVATRKYHDPDMRVQDVINNVIGVVHRCRIRDAAIENSCGT
jgi:hypothetical protein